MHLQGRIKHICCSKSLAAEIKYMTIQRNQLNLIIIYSLTQISKGKHSISLVILNVGYIKSYIYIYIYIYIIYK